MPSEREEPLLPGQIPFTMDTLALRASASVRWALDTTSCWKPPSLNTSITGTSGAAGRNGCQIPSCYGRNGLAFWVETASLLVDVVTRHNYKKGDSRH